MRRLRLEMTPVNVALVVLIVIAMAAGPDGWGVVVFMTVLFIPIALLWPKKGTRGRREMRQGVKLAAIDIVVTTAAVAAFIAIAGLLSNN